MEVMTYLGTQWGRFTNQQGQEISYCKVYVIDQPTVGTGSYLRGYRGLGIRLADPSITEKLKPMDRVKFDFDRRGSIVAAEKIED